MKILSLYICAHSPHSNLIDLMSRGTGGSDDSFPAVMNAAIVARKSQPIGMLCVDARYLDDKSSQFQLEQLIGHQAAMIGTPRIQQVLSRLVPQVVKIYCDKPTQAQTKKLKGRGRSTDKRICFNCNGTGSTIRFCVCPKCAGSGILPVSVSAIMAESKIRQDRNYSKMAVEFYENQLDRLYRHERLALRAMSDCYYSDQKKDR